VTDQADYAKLAAEALRRRADEARPREVSRDEGIGIVTQAMADRSRLRARRGLYAGVALVSVAAAAAVWVGVLTFRGPVSPGGANVRVENQAGNVSEHKLEHGQSVVAGHGRSTVVEFGSGTRITLKDQGELLYREDTALQRFGLVRGAAHLVVAKLAQGQRFVVDTEDAEVEVRGTVFDVAVQRGPESCPKRTVVSVTEGAVEVRSHGEKLMLRPGQRWEGPCAAPVLPPVAEAPRAPAVKAKAAPAPVAELPAVVHGAPETPAPAAAQEADSRLTEQNDLYAEATAAKKRGDAGRSLALYEKLLQRFPRGPLAESADVERIRLLKRADPERARELARRHVDRYRDGIASAELKALIDGP